MAILRLQKYLAQAGVASRRHAEELMRSGRVSVNGVTTGEMGIKVDSDTDEVLLDGEQVILDTDAEKLYIVLNKPPGYISSCVQQRKNAPLVVDLVNVATRVYPVGRLDKDSRGLMLLTNDGKLHLELSHPSFDHEKEYFVKLEKVVSANDIDKLRTGIELDGVKTRPAKIEIISDTSAKVILKEGRNRQLRRMFEAVGNNVIDLQRVRFANIVLGNLKEGQWRYLEKPELTTLLASLGQPAAKKT